MVLELKPPPEPSFAALLPLWPTGGELRGELFFYRHSVGEPSPSFAICESRSAATGLVEFRTPFRGLARARFDLVGCGHVLRGGSCECLCRSVC